MSYQVELSNVEPLAVAVVERKSPSAGLSKVIPSACGEVWSLIRAAGIAHSGLNIVIYRGKDSCDVLNLQCGVIVNDSFTDGPTVKCTTTPAGRAVTTVHMGPYDRLGDAYEALQNWCDARHVTRAASSWEIYGHWSDDPTQLRTDVFWLVDERLTRRPPSHSGNSLVDR